ncbi:MAG TPA: sensor histidine kinase [Anaerolineales bacterium]|nr:sensor histidine kinase [Anaerolineales bacterium]
MNVSAGLRSNRAVLFAARLTWLLVVGLSVALFAASLPGKVVLFRELIASNTDFITTIQQWGLSVEFYIGVNIARSILFALIYAIVGILIFWQKPNEPLAFYVSIMLVTFGMVSFMDVVPNLRAYPHWVYIIGQIIQYIGTVTVGWFAYVFPNGRFVPGWTRYAAGLWAAWHLWIMLSTAALIKVPAWVAPVETALTIAFVASWVLAQVIRYRGTSDSIQKQQSKWVMLGFSIAVVGWLLSTLLIRPAPGDLLLVELRATLQILFFLCIPLSIAFAIFRYRLWDIDLLVNRTLVYAFLSLMVATLYVLIVSGLGWMFRSEGSFYISLFATALIAVLFQPLREWLQAGVNRLLYGERDEPATVITRLGQRLEASLAPEKVLSAVVETAAQALKVSYAAISLRENDSFRRTAEYGQKSDASLGLLDLPLTYQSESVGRLSIAPRAPGESFTPADKRLLAMIAQQAGAAAYAVRLTHQLRALNADLQRSREELVNAREEERRHLRRELHDGLGPTLASLLQRVDKIRLSIGRDPQMAEQMAEDLKKQVKETVAEIRRMSYTLRPPALDEFGLVAAVREQIVQLQFENGISVSLESPQELPSLSAAVEVAVYRVALEAVTNAVRHAQAATCKVSITLDDGHLLLDVQDDGRGLPASSKTGVGILSMRERVEELGGDFQIKSNPGRGTSIQARFPLAGVK